MFKFTSFLIILFTIGIYDFIIMKKEKENKEMVPYLILMIAAGVTGIFYLINPFGPSILSMILNIFNIEG